MCGVTQGKCEVSDSENVLGYVCEITPVECQVFGNEVVLRSMCGVTGSNVTSTEQKTS